MSSRGASSAGSRGDAYDNAMAETVIELFKTELIRRRGLWRGLDDVECATLESEAWYNSRHLLEPLGYLPPTEYEAQYDTAQTTSAVVGALNWPSLRRTPGLFTAHKSNYHELEHVQLGWARGNVAMSRCERASRCHISRRCCAMAAQGKPSDVGQVPCEVCMKEIPRSEAMVAEATEYVLHFCGLECYTKWKTGDAKSGQQGGTAGSK